MMKTQRGRKAVCRTRDTGSATWKLLTGTHGMIRTSLKPHRYGVIGIAGLLTALSVCWGCAHRGNGLRDETVRIVRETIEDKQAYILENEFYRAILVPEIARFPLSLVHKPTGHEMFAQPVPLSTSNSGFQPFGGIVDCLPWVSGRMGDERLPDKGLLFTTPWETDIGGNGNSAWFEGRTQVEYTDLLDETTSRLQYIKRVSGRTGSPDIVMDHTIRNTGEHRARFTMTLHARTAIAGYTAGDYIYIPGDQADIDYMHYPELTERGITPPQTVAWPLPEAVEFRPDSEPRHIFLFTPAEWAVAGSDETGDALVFRGGKVSSPDGTDKVRMALFMTNHGYLLEPGLTSCIIANEKTWANPENTVMLEPEQECTFTVVLTPVSGVHRGDWPDAFDSLRED